MISHLFAFSFGALCMGAFMLWVTLRMSEKHCQEMTEEYDAGLRDGMNNSNSSSKNHE
jgi:hypothetical protein